MVGPEKQLFEKLASDSSAINPYYSSPAVKYLQKPTLQAMADNNCLYSRKKQSDGLFIDNSLSSSRESQNYDNWFALVDSGNELSVVFYVCRLKLFVVGVVVFTGVPFQVNSQLNIFE